jgi:hypothetical protein
MPDDPPPNRVKPIPHQVISPCDVGAKSRKRRCFGGFDLIIIAFFFFDATW